MESSININYEIVDEKYTSEEILSHQNSEELIDHTCDDNGNNLLNKEEEADITSIISINATNNIAMKDDENFINKYYAQFLSSKDHEDVSSGSDYD